MPKKTSGKTTGKTTGRGRSGGTKGGEPTPSARTVPGPCGVTIRMYFTGFGDCFLLTFPGDDNKPRYMLIDFGVHNTYPSDPERIRAIAKDIASVTGNRLDVIAISHEHVDHISGFSTAKEIFKTIEIGELWLAWTEDDTCDATKELTRVLGKKQKAIAAAIRRLGQAGSVHAERLKDLAGFSYGAAGAASSGRNAGIYEALRSWSKKSPKNSGDYLSPGDIPREIPGVSGVRCYVLGPPKSTEDIRKTGETKEEKGEMYLGGAMLDINRALIGAVLDDRGTGDPLLKAYPFDPKFSVPVKSAKDPWHAFFRKSYGLGSSGTDGPAWRRIDTLWLEQAAYRIALNVSEQVNNTSLVLAFALGGTLTRPERVLLFTGDAEVGNWLSWKDVTWREGKGSDAEVLDGDGLLDKTIVYKVAHHGSINATMKDRGLVKMKEQGLVALLPVDEAWAKGKDNPWQHPDPKVYAELTKKTEGRILRSDKIPPEMPEGGREDAWTELLKNVEWDPGDAKLWIQYTIA